MNEPRSVLCIFRDELRRRMDAHGFRWQEGDEVASGGEHYAWGQFMNGDRKLRLAFGDHLSLVKYHYREHVLDHPRFFQGITGADTQFDPQRTHTEPIGQARLLAEEIDRCAHDFLEGHIGPFLSIAGVQPSAW